MPDRKKAPSNLYIPDNTDAATRRSSRTAEPSLHSDEVDTDLESEEEEYLDDDDDDVYVGGLQSDRLTTLEKRIRDLEAARRFRSRDSKEDISEKRRSSVRDWDDAKRMSSIRDTDIERGPTTPYPRTPISRVVSRVSHTATLEKTKSVRSLGSRPPLSAGFGFHAPPIKDYSLVEWDGPDDPECPKNWGWWYKVWVTVWMSLITLCATFNSSIFSTGIHGVAEHFDVSAEVVTLGTSFTVVGYAFGPLIFGPMSELFGRKLPMFAGYIPFVIFLIPQGVASNLETVLLSRFFTGLFGAAPIAVTGGAFGDIWSIVPRTVAIILYGCSVFLGPVFAPIIGSFVAASIGWRWLAWVTMILASTVGLVVFFTVKETYEPVLLQRKAAKLRYQTKNWALHAKLDETPIDMNLIVHKYLTRVFVMLVKEPILVLITLYMALIYGIIYLMFSAFPLSFEEVRGWSQGVGSLPFAGLIVGAVISSVVGVWEVLKIYNPKLFAGTNTPEDRLPLMIIGGISMTVGLFWFAWTSDPGISWVPQVISIVPMGFGICCIFLQGFNYIIDCYLVNANSALAGNTVVRSAFGAGFPLFATQMYHKLGVAWATTLLGFLCAAMVPIPIVFYFYGKKIRSYSKFVPTI